ncbi:MAG: hypothetical protein UT77_C0010G0022 [Candidatus Daviesbacteria bacterium GW2011_GWC2_40_12]|uniref:Vitamin K epoxide reductase domain-containing protein n=1 Tax=Candidatus Daviesbacteria bacterium GW2011_GWC2_40_12 TaxID=1618431 RepID=A0A0G0QVW7_9BACT|nr:MAG: hypothetical protein UT45_C0010G0022 [Candidatus Daviesbacteria bacterium GW2011_GWA2_39_33]KKR41496.1 MAG: hypothetical protein UT77_C0010G0022 [Candidatus Daviesbacteria bacterium GW2011_GWC2_40_12]
MRQNLKREKNRKLRQQQKLCRMISSNLSNRLIFIFSLFGLFVSSFLLYEYNFASSVVCPTGAGCDIVRASPYSSFLGISIPILGVIFYLGMAVLSVLYSQKSFQKIIFKLHLLGSLVGIGFGVYLTYLEIYVIRAICFWCVASFIISMFIALSVIFRRRNENGN